MPGYIDRGVRVDALIPKWPMSQSVFLVTVRHSYAGGMTIAESFDIGMRTAVGQYPGFVPRFEPNSATYRTIRRRLPHQFGPRGAGTGPPFAACPHRVSRRFSHN